MKLIAILTILSLASTACAFEVSSSHPAPGEKVTLTGTANPGQKVDFQTSFQMDLPVNSGKYEYVANGVDIPQKPNQFAVTATGIKDLNVGVKIGIWISKGFQATNGVATVSHSDVPPGRYDLKVFGEALDGSRNVNLKVAAETAVNADKAGKYSLDIDTSGIPSGAYKIEGAGETKIIQVGNGRETSNIQNTDSTDSVQSDSAEKTPAATGLTKNEESQGVEITPEVITWYAGHIGLDPKNRDQYSKAEKGLNNMISGGYWKVINKGEPLTEKAGDCQDKYCLVRGIDACTTCRLEEIVQLSASDKKTQAVKGPISNQSNMNETPNSHDTSQTGQENDRLNGLIKWLTDLFQRILGFAKGA